MDESQDGPPEGSAKTDKSSDVDHGGWDQAGHKGGPRNAGHTGHLGRVHPQARKQTGREDGPPTPSAQQLRGSLQRLLGVQRPRDLHNAVPAEKGRDLATQHRAEDDGDQRQADHEYRIDPAACDGDAADREHDVARREGQRDPNLLHEQEASNRQDQRRPAKGLDEGHSLQARRISFAPRTFGSHGAYSEVTSNRGGVSMIVVTTEEVTGHRIVEMKGQVFGLVVRSRGLGGNIMAGLRSIGGGEIVEYTELLEDARRHAIDRRGPHGTALGANAVIRMKYDSSEFGSTMSEIVAYGTAAVIEPLKS